MDILAFMFNENKPRIWLYVIFIVLLLSQTLQSASYGQKNGVTLQVYTHQTALSSYKRSDLSNEDYFITGTDGELYWHPKSFTQALLLDTVDNHGGLDIFEILLLCVLAGIFYFTVRGSGTNHIFSHNLYYGFLLMIFLITISGSLKHMEYGWMGVYVKTITKGKFVLQPLNISYSFYGALGTMLFFLMQFPKKALNMQKEQELTI